MFFGYRFPRDYITGGVGDSGGPIVFVDDETIIRVNKGNATYADLARVRERINTVIGEWRAREVKDIRPA
ncbi:MAG: hypothetical protein AAF850_06955 [Pseudomonadota bacterium]